MKLISHRGNLNGSFESYENEPNYIDLAIRKGFDVEVDIWFVDNTIYLGHDKPQYEIEFKWIKDRLSYLWIHCKNVESMVYLKSCGYSVNYFWHQKDEVTITSQGFFWTYPGKKLTEYSIAVMPEIAPFENIEKCLGICSDFIQKYNKTPKKRKCGE